MIPFIDNSLFSQDHFAVTLKELYTKNDILYTASDTAYQNLKELIESVIQNPYNTKIEEDVKVHFIVPILKELGFGSSFSMESSYTIAGKIYKLDALLYSSIEKKQDYDKTYQLKSPTDLIIVEMKAQDVPLDTKKSDFTNNAHHQIVNYSNNLSIPLGMTTNGIFWRFYDNSEKTKYKRYYEVNIKDLMKNGSKEDFFIYFYGVFAKSILMPNEEQEETFYDQFKEQETIIKENIKSRLIDVLYGTDEHYDSVIEIVGENLYKTFVNDTTITLKDIFHNTLIFIFRVLFMANYESRYQKVLNKHDSYYRYSIFEFLDQLYTNKSRYTDDSYTAWNELWEIFTKLNKGDDRFNIPMLNGGLFSSYHAPLLENTTLFTNQVMFEILTNLLVNIKNIKEVKNNLLDFRSLDSETLGSIYEISLSYEFRIAQDVTYLVQYKENGMLKTQTLDTYDFTKAQGVLKYQDFQKRKEYAKRDIFLTSFSGERKRTGSYYTPEIFGQFLVKEGIDTLVLENKNPLNLKIIDNSCGSGHFLLYSLDFLSWKTMEYLNHEQLSDKVDPKHKAFMEQEKIVIQDLIEQEKSKVIDNIKMIIKSSDDTLQEIIKDETSDEKIIRRLVLKRCLFGVDLQPIAVEITMISLWMETFIFATPLSFIEHHMKVGNSLLYVDMKELQEKIEDADLFMTNELDVYKNDLKDLLKTINTMQDITVEDIKKSKDKFYKEVEPKITEMRAMFNYFFYLKYVETLYKKDPNRMVLNHQLEKVNKWKQEETWLKTKGTDFKTLKTYISRIKDWNEYTKQVKAIDEDIQKIRNTVLTQEWRDKWNSIVKQYSWFNPFHTEIEFPDVVNGFDLVIGNPPWDKVRFEEDAFFSLLDSSYHSQKHSGKLAIRERYISYPWVQTQYKQEQTISDYNCYLQNAYPLAKGGEGNLFRYFIARNIRLLAPNGALSYLTPSAFMMENSSTTLRKYVLEHYQFNYFYQFENKGNFKAIHNQFKFALWQIQNINPTNNNIIQTRFLQQSTDFLAQEKEQWVNHNIPYSLNLLKDLAPEHYRFLELKAPIEKEMIQKAQALFNPLTQDYINFRNELDMSADKKLFEELPKNKNEVNTWQRGGVEHLPLYEGKMVHQFNAQYAAPTYWVKEEALKNKLQSREIKRIIAHNPEKKGVSADVLKEEIKWPHHQVRLAYREIAANTNERTVISSLIPPCTFGNTVWAGEGLSNAQLLFVQSGMNSLVFDFLARMIVEIHVTKSLLMRLPLPQPNAQTLQTQPYKTIVHNAATMQVLNTPGLFPTIQKEFGINPTGKTFPQSVSAREKMFNQLRFKNDLLVAKLYQITPAEYEYMLTTFPIFNKKNPWYSLMLKQEINCLTQN